MAEGPSGLLDVARRGAAADRRSAIQLAVLTLANNLAMPLRAIWFGLLIDSVLDPGGVSPVVWAVVLSITDGARSWALLSANMVKLDLQDRALQGFHEEVIGLTGGVPGVEHQERPEYLDRLDILRAGFPVLAGAFATVVTATVLAVRVLITLTLLAGQQPLLLALPLFAVPSVVAGRRSEGANQRAARRSTPVARQAEHLHTVLASPTAAKEVRAFRLVDRLVGRYRELWRTVDGIQLRGKLRAEAVKLAAWSVFGLGYGGAILLLSRQVIEGRTSAGELVLAIILGAQVNQLVAEAATTAGKVAEVQHTTRQHRWLRDWALDTSREGGAPAPERLVAGIRLADVSFRYPGQDTDVLTGVDVDLPAGTTVAIVGDNGAGKSTLVKLFTGMYEPTAGRVLVDGQDLTAVDPASWRERVTATFQDFVRFELLVREGVGIGALAEIESEPAVREALASAGGASLAESLPGGLDAYLAPSFGGLNVSGGQWQKVALARSKMRARPLLQVLDEPSTALDPDAEYELFERYVAAAHEVREAGGITILISHRFSTVRMVDLVIVLAAGRVVEVGDHASLMERAGTYAELYELQAGGYR